MGERKIEITITEGPDDTFEVSIWCPDFVDRDGGYVSIEDAMQWATRRIERSDDPFQPYKED